VTIRRCCGQYRARPDNAMQLPVRVPSEPLLAADTISDQRTDSLLCVALFAVIVLTGLCQGGLQLQLVTSVKSRTRNDRRTYRREADSRGWAR
jgi:hypothetical protein